MTLPNKAGSAYTRQNQIIREVWDSNRC